MKKKTKITYTPDETVTRPAVLRQVAVLPEAGESISVRSAKAHLSGLLDLVAGGREILITSDGQPKALLSPVAKRRPRQVFPGMGAFLLRQPVHGGPSAEELIREDRDGRGW